MLDKLIQNLPGPLKKLLGGETNTSEKAHSEEEGGDSHDTGANETVDSPEDKKKKQISMLIRVIVVLALAYFVVDEMFLKEKTPELPAVAAKPRRNRNKTLPKIEDKKADATQTTTAPKEAAAKAEEVRPETKIPEKQDDSLANQSPVENINIAEKKSENEVKEVPVQEEPKQEEIPIDNTPILNNVGEMKTSEPEDKLDKMIDGLESNAKKTSDSKKAPSLEDKIVQDEAAYTPPPAYDKTGRGLVYNCKDKYWACIDKASYVICNKNQKWNKSHGKASECSVQAVYNNDDDCGTIQKYNVSTNKTTDFCSN